MLIQDDKMEGNAGQPIFRWFQNHHYESTRKWSGRKNLYMRPGKVASTRTRVTACSGGGRLKMGYCEAPRTDRRLVLMITVN